MVSIREYQEAIKKRREESLKAKQNLERLGKAIPKTTQEQLRGARGNPQGLAGRKFQRQLESSRGKVQEARGKVSEYEIETEQYSKEFENYLRSPSGKLKYAKEFGLSPSRYEYRKYAKGYARHAIPVYSTPYGEVVDEEEWARYVRGQAKAEARSLGFDSVEDMQESLAVTRAMGSNVFVTSTGRNIPINQAGVQSLNQQLNVEINKEGADLKQLEKAYGVDLSDLRKEYTRVSRTQQEKANTILSPSSISYSSLNLNKTGGKINDTNVSTGDNLLVRGVSRFRNFITGNVIGSVDDFQKAKEIYSPQLGGFVQATEGGGREFSKGTAIVRSPTIKETYDIQQANYKGSPEGMIETIRDIPAIKKIRESDFVQDVKVKVNEFDRQTMNWLETKRIPKDEQPIYSPDNIKKVFDYGAEQTIRGGEFLGGQVQRVVDYSGANNQSNTYQLFFNSSKIPVKRTQVKEGISNLYTFSAFGHFIKTGTAQYSQYADEVVEVTYNGQKVKMLKSEAIRRNLYMSEKQATGEFGRASLDRQVKIIKDAFSNRAYLDTASQNKDILQATKFMKQSGLSNDRIKEILIKLFPERFQVTTPTIVSSGSSTTQTSASQIGVQVDLSQVGQMNNIGFVGSAVSNLQIGSNIRPQEVGTTQWLGTDTTTSLAIDTATDTGIRQSNRNLTTLDFGIKQIQRNRQDTATDQRTGQTFLKPPTTKLEAPTTTTTTNIFRTPTGKPPITPTKPEPTKPIKPIKPIPPITPLMSWVKRKAKEPEKEFEVFVKKGGKPLSLGKKKSKQEAKKTLLKELGGTLRASGFIEESGKKVPLSSLGYLGGGYRRSKKEKEVLVQLKGQRFGTKGETREAQFFRKTKKKGGKTFRL